MRGVLRASIVANVLLLGAVVALLLLRQSATREADATSARLADAEQRVRVLEWEGEQWKSVPGGGPGTAQPLLQGHVVSADEKLNLVVVDLGSEVGVKPGDRFTISRGATYVAQIEITHVDAKQSTGRALPTSKGPSRVGDDVQTTSGPR